jgi:hypothetical protein
MGGKSKLLMFGAKTPFGFGFTAGFKVFNQLLAAFNLDRVAWWVQLKYFLLIKTGINPDIKLLARTLRRQPILLCKER